MKGRGEAGARPIGERGRGRTLALLAVAAPLLLTYGLTVCRDLGSIDSGELAAVAARLGVAHPSGYPVYTLVAHLATRYLPGPPILLVNWLSAACAVIAALLVARTAGDIAGRVRGTRASPAFEFVGPAAGLWLGWSSVFWDQATGNEVYALHCALVALVVWLLLRLDRASRRPAEFLLLAYAFGIGMAHHLSILFLAPATLWVLLGRHGVLRARLGGMAPLTLVALLAASVVLGYSAVLYLPVRSSQAPLLDWGSPHEWHRFWRHVLAAQYRVWFLESGEEFRRNLMGYLGSIPERFFPPILLLAAIGAAHLARQARRILETLGLVIVVTALWASSYDIHDLEPYYLPADLAIVLLASAGGTALLRSAPAGGRRYVAGTLVLLATVQGWIHFRGADRSRDHFVRAHAEAVLRSLPDHAVLASRHWDALVSPWLYLREIESLRPDVMVVDTELLRRSWYLDGLERWDPELADATKPARDAFLPDVKRFESGRPYDPATIETHYRQLIASAVLAMRPSRPGAFTIDVLADYPPLVQATFFAPAYPVPEGLVFVLRDDPKESPRLAPPDVGVLLRSGYRRGDRIHEQVLDHWRVMLNARVRFLEGTGRLDEAEEWRRQLERLSSAK